MRVDRPGPKRWTALSRRDGRAVRGAAATALALLALAGCSRFSAAHDAPAGASESAPAAPDRPQADSAADSAVLAAYRGYWNSAVTAWTQGSLNGVPLTRYATGLAESAVRSTLRTYRAAGVVTQGQPRLEPKVSALHLSVSPYTATVTDCVDETHFYKVSKSTGAHSAASVRGQHPAVYQAQYNGGWRIVSGSVDPSRRC
ncbi:MULTISPECIES: hypothetical protein [Streptomyces]|nr:MULTISPECIES: hypothetical protein [Streptomyces]MDI5906853.1 hypothetical protein [Streptomyces sp. 12257]